MKLHDALDRKNQRLLKRKNVDVAFAKVAD